MRLVLATNAAGDIRLQCLRDKVHIEAPPPVAAPLLDCSSLFQEMTTRVKDSIRAGFGKISTRNTLSRYAKTLVRESGAILDNGPLRSLVFLTGTLPGSTPEALQALSAWSGWVVQTLSQWIRDNAPRAQYLGVWEYQKRGALHVHICIRAESALQANRLRWRWKARWIKVLDSLEKRSGVDMYARLEGGSWRDSKWVTQADAQQVEKSVARYLSKYLSKGAGKARRRCEDPPSRWVFVSRSLAASARSERKSITIPNLSLAAGLDFFERLGSEIAECAKTAAVYVSPYDYQVKGCIALTTPQNAGMLFRSLNSLFRAMGARGRASVNDLCDLVQSARIVFGGRLIADTT